MVLNFSTGSGWVLVIFCCPDWEQGFHLIPNELSQPLLSHQLRRRRKERILVKCSKPAAFGAETGKGGDSSIEKFHQSPFRYPGASNCLCIVIVKDNRQALWPCNSQISLTLNNHPLSFFAARPQNFTFGAEILYSRSRRRTQGTAGQLASA